MIHQTEMPSFQGGARACPQIENLGLLNCKLFPITGLHLDRGAEFATRIATCVKNVGKNAPIKTFLAFPP